MASTNGRTPKVVAEAVESPLTQSNAVIRAAKVQFMRTARLIERGLPPTDPFPIEAFYRQFRQLPPGVLLIAGATGHGKTSLAMHIFLRAFMHRLAFAMLRNYMAKQGKIRISDTDAFDRHPIVGLIVAEDGTDAVVSALVESLHPALDRGSVYGGFVPPELGESAFTVFEKLLELGAKFGTRYLIREGISLPELLLLVKQVPPGSILVVDYASALPRGNLVGMQYEAMWRQIASAAMANRVRLIVMDQLSADTGVGTRGGKGPFVVAHYAIFLGRYKVAFEEGKDYHNIPVVDTHGNEHTLHVRVLKPSVVKNRSGGLGAVRMYFAPGTMTIVSGRSLHDIAPEVILPVFLRPDLHGTPVGIIKPEILRDIIVETPLFTYRDGRMYPSFLRVPRTVKKGKRIFLVTSHLFDATETDDLMAFAGMQMSEKDFDVLETLLGFIRKWEHHFQVAVQPQEQELPL